MRSVLNKLKMLAVALTALSTFTGHARTVAVGGKFEVLDL